MENFTCLTRNSRESESERERRLGAEANRRFSLEDDDDKSAMPRDERVCCYMATSTVSAMFIWIPFVRSCSTVKTMSWRSHLR